MIPSSLPNTSVVLERSSKSTDASGGTVNTWATQTAAFTALVVPANSFVSAEYARRDLVVNYQLITNADVNALLAGGVKAGDRINASGAIYVIHGVRPYSSALGGSKVVVLDCELRSA